MLKRTLTALALCASTTSVFAQANADPDPFVEAIEANVLAIERSADGRLSGPGWNRLIEEGRQAQFFLMGEQHATADLAQVEAAIHADLAPAGYEHMVVEVGPWSTRHTEELIRAGNGEVARFIATPGNEFTLPFLFFREEIALVEQAVALSSDTGPVLWGVDQEFLAAGTLLAAKLQELALTDAQSAAAAGLAEDSASQFMYLGSAPQEDIDELVAAFAESSHEARELVKGIELTHRIYGPFVRSTGPIYPANLERENYMKANFIAHFREAEQRLGYAPKAVFKFGGFHLERGLSGTNVPSLGNFVMEWGRSRGFATVNVLLDCIGGEGWDIQQSKPSPCTSYSLKEGSPILAALDDEKIAVVDLKALRPLLRRSTKIDEESRDLILSYDYYLAVRDVRPATPVAELVFPK